jgi:hypothetical protein
MTDAVLGASTGPGELWRERIREASRRCSCLPRLVCGTQLGADRRPGRVQRNLRRSSRREARRTMAGSTTV